MHSIKLISETDKGTLVKLPAKISIAGGRITFVESPFSMKDEIKVMKGSKWHGYDDPPQKVWSVEDCPRNWVQLKYLMGENPFEWFDRPIIKHEYDRPLMDHQKHLADTGLTYHYQIWAAEMGCGKTLSAIEVMEKSNLDKWYWVGPKSTLLAIEREFEKWNLQRVDVNLMTYENLTSLMDYWSEGDELPPGVIFDESSKLKNDTAQRSRAAQKIADLIRGKYGQDGYVLLMSGTPAPKTPMDWWSQAEIAWPGFLREGSRKALEQRLSFMAEKFFDSGPVMKRIGWKDDSDKCAICGEKIGAMCHDEEYCEDRASFHKFKKSIDEVSLMYERLKGLVVVKHKKDCLQLPDKYYRRINCKPNKSVMRVAKALVQSTPSAVQALTLLRELSDGFQYRETEAGKTTCKHCLGTKLVDEWFDPNDPEARYGSIDMLDSEIVSKLEQRVVDCPNCEGTGEMKTFTRTTREIPTPKEGALKELLNENEEHGRIVIFGGFTGSIDRIKEICIKNRWDVVRCDGRGFHLFCAESDGLVTVNKGQEALKHWAESPNRVAFVAHPESGGMGLTLTEASMAVFWSNSFKPEFRVQAEDRIHRPGMDDNRGATIVDLIHLSTDERVLDVILENRKVELMTMGEVMEEFEIDYEKV